MEKNRAQFIRTAVLTSLSLYQLKRSSLNWLTIIKYLRCTQQAFGQLRDSTEKFFAKDFFLSPMNIFLISQ